MWQHDAALAQPAPALGRAQHPNGWGTEILLKQCCFLSQLVHMILLFLDSTNVCLRQGNRRPWLLPGRGFRYGATSQPNQAITNDQEIPWLSGRLVVGFVATAAIGEAVAMVALVATEPTLVATDPTLVATEATLGVTKAAHADRFGLTTIPTFGAPLGRAISPL